MNIRPTIQKGITVFLLLIFAISVVPKAYFHDLVADHKDFSSCHQLHKSAVLHKQGYNCHFDDLVVSAPYLLQSEPSVVFVNFYFEKEQSLFQPSLLQFFLQHKENRGPPAV